MHGFINSLVTITLFFSFSSYLAKADPGSEPILDLGDLELKLEAFKKERNEFVDRLKESDRRIEKMIKLASRCKNTEQEAKLEKDKPSFFSLREKLVATLDKSETVIVVDSKNVCTGGFEKTFQNRKALYEAIKKDLVSSGVSKKLSQAEHELFQAKGAAKALFEQGRGIPEWITNQKAPSRDCQMRHEREIMGTFDETLKWIVATKKKYIGVHSKIDDVNKSHEKIIAYGLEKKVSCEQSDLAKSPKANIPSLGSAPANEGGTAHPAAEKSLEKEHTRAPASHIERSPTVEVPPKVAHSGPVASMVDPKAQKVALDAEKARSDLNQPSELLEPDGDIVRADPPEEPAVEPVKIAVQEKAGNQNELDGSKPELKKSSTKKRRPTRAVATQDDWKWKALHPDGI